MQSDPARMAIIEKLGNLRGGVAFVDKGAWHEGTTLRIAMSNRDTASQDYQTTMRHEYGHHIDAVMDRYFLAKTNAPQTFVENYGWVASRRALPAIAQDAKDLEASLIRTAPTGWTTKPQQAAPGAEERVNEARQKLREQLGLEDRDSAAAAYQKLEAEFAKRGLDFKEAQQVCPDLKLEPGAVPDNSRATFRAARNAVDFLVSYDQRDHWTLLTQLASYERGSPLVGLSDSIGASTLQDIGYNFGHGQDYYQKFLVLSRGANLSGKRTDFTHTASDREYGVGTSAQLFANWFEAWTSGNATQYAVFVRFFPRTSKIFEAMVEEALR
jgi:hypothetical protein